jgi:hypothetical protein
MRNAQETLKASFDALEQLDDMAFEMSDCATAFDATGNTRMAELLESWSHRVSTRVRHIREAISEDVNRRATASTQASAMADQKGMHPHPANPDDFWLADDGKSVICAHCNREYPATGPETFDPEHEGCATCGELDRC